MDTALEAFIHEISLAIDKKIKPVGLFIDFTKAFECVDHSILLRKLEAYGVRGVTLSWFSSYLNSRTQYVEVNGLMSGGTDVLVGVPQGSVLGPTLFLIYINDLVQYINDSDILLINYADDTNILITDQDLNITEQKANDVLCKIYDWARRNKLLINNDKTKAVIFTNRTRSPTMQLHYNVPVSDSVKMLGLTIDQHLSWTQHIDNLCGQLARIVYAIRCMAKFCNREVLRAIYFANFHSLVRYGITHWGLCPDAGRVLLLQKQVVRVIAGLGPRESCRNAFREHHILTAPGLYVFEILRVAYEHRRELTTIQHGYSTRYKSNTLITDQHTTSKYQKQQTYNLCRFFNHLSPETRGIRTLTQFKSKMKALLIDSVIYKVDEFFEFSC